MKLFAVSLIAGAALVATQAMAADEGMELAKKSNCLTCHSVDAKLVGPAYKDVAKKYKGDKGAEAKLVKKVLDGGSGVWGNVPMPPNKATGLTEANAKKLVSWILSLK